MKKIAITQRIVENSNYFEIRDCLDVQWASLLRKAGVLPIILPSQYDFNIYFNELEIDGIIFSGGNDLSIYSGSKIDKERDKLEERIIKYAIEKSMPVLGICRGMQFMGHYFGMRLKKVNNHVGQRHEIIINKRSKYYYDLKGINQVNSYHNYGFEEITDEFIASAVSKDGIIEAMEHKYYKIFLQMWHPERQRPFCDNYIGFIKKYFGIV
ncbi:putative glutamine amidotransferase-like protein yvdE [Proteiniborus sp. DW1]|uniref:gamma-glutamyl-gamma-aminobutyrate hydrolase family protein n=1 Tax=Proteiniborus sp. DW1 TaxID=1889883 RepID=UPI00092E0D18|nr:gamma-glutamyl-gamma-aminobutyrate hydrolase family protein [Proteiniborus sp. DW1]SCG81933.1 putative glutamine amidotransferase-like protein yvdE [Proteiniborus sp. DW1]